MAVIYDVMNYAALLEAIQAAGTFNSITSAVESGYIYIVEDQALGGLAAIEGGAAIPATSTTETALALAQSTELAATHAKVETAATTLFKTETGFKLAGLMKMSLPQVAAAAAPLAGVVLGAGLYELNPSLWTKISKTLLPFAYDDENFQVFLDFANDTLLPIPLIATSIIDALKQLFAEEVTFMDLEKYEVPGEGVYTVFTLSEGQVVGYDSGGNDILCPRDCSGKPCLAWVDYSNQSHIRALPNGVDHVWAPGYVTLTVPLSPGFRSSFPGIEPEIIPKTAGVEAPSVPVEPIVWPDVPIIIVPEPLGPDYQPIPVTPITPALPPAPEVPLLPAPAEDPTPEVKPDNWPDEEPWPTVIPFPDQPTEPDPDWPTVIPWPLPENPPEEWPTHPDEWPDIEPWPAIPEKWPEDVPWPESPPDPEKWPDEIPWPESPDEWPDEVPWPTPWPEDWPLSPEKWPDIVPWPEGPEEWPETEPWPESPPDPETWPETLPWPEGPEEWPETVPWPEPPPWPVHWPPEIPYPIPFPYPWPSPDPYPPPDEIDDPEKLIDPWILPWPLPWPEPYPEPTPDPDPDPYDDPSKPEPLPEPEPDPDPEPGPEPQPEPWPSPPDPYPTPPSGDIEPSPPPIIPLPFSGTTGLISVYHPTQSELLAFANWLWVTWQDATIEKIWNNPFDGIITLFELYCTPTDVGRKNIRSGFLDSEISSETISRYTSINCGSIGVPEYFGNYLDYSPYSKCHIYLPFIGIVELNVDDIVGHGVNVTYRIDEYNGSCIAMVTVARSTVVNGVSVDYTTVMYQFSGNCSVELPIAGGSQAAIKAGMIQAAAYGISSVVSGILNGAAAGTAAQALADVGSGIAQGAANAIGSLVSAKSSVQHSGSFGSSFGALGNKKPYIIVTRPKQIQVPNYNLHYGYQAHKMVRIGECTGYIRCREVHVISPTASDEEKTLIEQLLKTGVYVTE